MEHAMASKKPEVVLMKMCTTRATGGTRAATNEEHAWCTWRLIQVKIFLYWKTNLLWTGQTLVQISWLTFVWSLNTTPEASAGRTAVGGAFELLVVHPAHPLRWPEQD